MLLENVIPRRQLTPFEGLKSHQIFIRSRARFLRSRPIRASRFVGTTAAFNYVFNYVRGSDEKRQRHERRVNTYSTSYPDPRCRTYCTCDFSKGENAYASVHTVGVVG